MRTSRISLGTLTLVLLFICILPGAALAHIGISSSDGFLDGFLHPITGLDHLVTMLGLGLWMSFYGKGVAWRISTASITMLLFGVLLGLGGFDVPLMGTLIALSLLILGLMIVLRMRLPMLSGMAIVGLFGVLHGYAHGLEVPLTYLAIPYAIGLVSTSLLLQLTGYSIGCFLKRRTWALEVSGAVVAGTSIWFIGGV